MRNGPNGAYRSSAWRPVRSLGDRRHRRRAPGSAWGSPSTPDRRPRGRARRAGRRTHGRWSRRTGRGVRRGPWRPRWVRGRAVGRWAGAGPPGGAWTVRIVASLAHGPGARYPGPRAGAGTGAPRGRRTSMTECVRTPGRAVRRYRLERRAHYLTHPDGLRQHFVDVRPDGDERGPSCCSTGSPPGPTSTGTGSGRWSTWGSGWWRPTISASAARTSRPTTGGTPSPATATHSTTWSAPWTSTGSTWWSRTGVARSGCARRSPTSTGTSASSSSTPGSTRTASRTRTGCGCGADWPSIPTSSAVTCPPA